MCAPLTKKLTSTAKVSRGAPLSSGASLGYLAIVRQATLICFSWLHEVVGSGAVRRTRKSSVPLPAFDS